MNNAYVYFEPNIKRIVYCNDLSCINIIIRPNKIKKFCAIYIVHCERSNFNRLEPFGGLGYNKMFWAYLK